MKKAYLFLSILMVIVAVSLILLPARTMEDEISPKDLLMEINDPSRYLSTDQVADRMISGDPSLLLADSRDSFQFKEYHLPGAYLIPVNELADPSCLEILNQEGKDIIFYSNDDILAEQAWVISKRMGLNNIYVMKDGLNRWMETIIRPQMPPQTAASEEFDLYHFRLGASSYFGGGANAAITEKPISEPIIFQKKVKKASAEGGC